MNSLSIFLILIGIFLIYTNKNEYYKLKYRNNKSKNLSKKVNKNLSKKVNKNLSKKVNKNLNKKINKNLSNNFVKEDFIKKYVKEDYILRESNTKNINYNEISKSNNKYFKNFFGKPDEWSNLHGYKINLKK